MSVLRLFKRGAHALRIFVRIACVEPIKDLCDMVWTLTHYRMKVMISSRALTGIDTLPLRVQRPPRLYQARVSIRFWSVVPIDGRHTLCCRGRHGMTLWASWDDEGRTWCRGWTGPRVEALRTVLLLDQVDAT